MIRRFWNHLTDKRQLSMRDRSSDEVHWRVNLSPMGLAGIAVSIVAIIFGVVLLLVAYTSVLDVFPSFRTKSEAMHTELVASIMRLDSMERHMNEILAYNEAVAEIMGGSTPTLHSTVMTDTIRYDKSRILPTRADSLLRRALESTSGDYSLANTQPLQSEAAMFSSPMRGTITRTFDAPESSYDIAILSIDGDDSVMAVENGTVIASERTSDGLNSVTIQHSGGYISVYKQLGEVLVRKGQTLQSGAVIGRLTPSEGGASDDVANADAHTRELAFELWRDGTAVDPQRYILF